jgi:hypothetical protein
MVDCGLLGLAGGFTKHVQVTAASNPHCCRIEARSVQALPFWEGAMTVAELIEKLSALPDKTARVVKSPGPWDLDEPNKIYDGYLDKEMQFPVQATDPDAIHVVYL